MMPAVIALPQSIAALLRRSTTVVAMIILRLQWIIDGMQHPYPRTGWGPGGPVAPRLTCESGWPRSSRCNNYRIALKRCPRCQLDPDAPARRGRRSKARLVAVINH